MAKILHELRMYGGVVGRDWMIEIKKDGYFEVTIGECFRHVYEFAVDAANRVKHLL